MTSPYKNSIAICSHCHKRVKPIFISPRVLEVLDSFMAEKSTKETAFDLNISVKTVETYIAQLYRLAGTNNRIGLLRWALKIGFTFPGEDRKEPDPLSPFYASPEEVAQG
jgi:DNA-binding CsgD family transcriptional regulator